MVIPRAQSLYLARIFLREVNATNQSVENSQQSRDAEIQIQCLAANPIRNHDDDNGKASWLIAL